MTRDRQSAGGPPEQAKPTGSGACLRARLVGGARFTWEGEDVTPRAAKGSALLAYLAVEPQPVSREELTLLLWGPGRARNLRQALHALRQLEGADRWLDAGDPLDVSADCDVRTIERLVRAERWEEALAQLGGPFLGDLQVPGDLPFHEWRAGVQGRVEAFELAARIGRARELVRDDDVEAALAQLALAAAIDPLDETPVQLELELLRRQGRRADAEARYASFRRHYWTELGMEPSAALAAAAAAATARRRPPSVKVNPELAPGRERELETLSSAARAQRPMVLRGPPGVGKSHLARAFARSRGRTLEVSIAGSSGSPFGAFERLLAGALDDALVEELPGWALAELARVAPNTLPAVTPTTAPPGAKTATAQDLVYEKACRRFDAIVLDGLESADIESLAAFLRMLGRPPVERRAAVLVTAGPRLDDATSRALDALVAARRCDALTVEPLTARGAREMLQALGLSGDREQARAVHALSGGSPYAIAQLAQTLSEHPARLDPDQPAELLSRPLQAHLLGRLADLERPARFALEALAVCDEPPATDVLAAALELDELALLDALAEAEAAGLVRDGWIEGDLLQEVVRLGTSPPRAHALHRRLAAAFEAAGDPMRAASHWSAAGAPDRAAPRFLEAADQALLEGDYATAAPLLRRALDEGPKPADRGRAWLGLADIARARAAPEEEAAALEHAERDARRTQDDHALFAVTVRLAEHALAQRSITAAEPRASEALEIAERLGDARMLARAHAARGTQRLRAGQLGEAEDDFAIAAAGEEPEHRIAGLWGLGACAGCRADLARAKEAHREALTLARAEGRVDWAIRLLNGLGATAERAGDYVESAERFSQALELTRDLDDHFGEGSVLLNLAEVRRKAGDLGPAYRALLDADHILERLGSPRLRAVSSEIWGLLELSLGNLDEAQRRTEETLRLAAQLEDQRRIDMARFNRALVDVARSPARFDDALDAALALRPRALEVCAWALVELALWAPDARARDRALSELGPVENPHLSYLLSALRGRPTPPGDGRRFLEATWLHEQPADLDGLDEARRACFAEAIARRRAAARAWATSVPAQKSSR